MASPSFERTRKAVIMLAAAGEDVELLLVAADEIGTDPREWVRIAVLASRMFAGTVRLYSNEVGIDPSSALQELSLAELR